MKYRVRLGNLKNFMILWLGGGSIFLHKEAKLSCPRRIVWSRTTEFKTRDKTIIDEEYSEANRMDPQIITMRTLVDKNILAHWTSRGTIRPNKSTNRRWLGWVAQTQTLSRGDCHRWGPEGAWMKLLKVHPGMDKAMSTIELVNSYFLRRTCKVAPIEDKMREARLILFFLQLPSYKIVHKIQCQILLRGKLKAKIGDFILFFECIEILNFLYRFLRIGLKEWNPS